MKTFERSDRVSEFVKKTLATILSREVSDPRLREVTVSSVKISSDLKSAKIYFAISGGKKKKEKAVKGFESAKGYIKRSLAENLGLRYMPEINFFYDDSFDYSERIEKILKSIKPANEN